MGDRMTPIPFPKLMDWILAEKKESGKVFGIRRPFVKEKDQVLHIFGETIETPFGPAAGPNTQLAQNIIAAYYTGSRFFELKTVQVIDGEDLPVKKPCILAEDEGYNCEWSTELKVSDALSEYIKAWIALKILSKEFGLGSQNGFVFNMSVGYDLTGIQSEKINTFIDNLIDAKNTAIWKECIYYLNVNLSLFKNIDKSDIDTISSKICTSVTVSTLHGCPPQEIESIASYLLNEKHLNTYIKCNPTLLGYETARTILNEMGYEYIVFDDFHFKNDLQFEDAVPMLQRLQNNAEALGLEFGVKLTNTFPVDVTRNELPSKEMYMSGRPLCALSLSVAYQLSRAMDGKLRISYSGGADYFNIDQIFNLNIWPITMATTFLKTGGYQRGTQIAEKLESLEYRDFKGVSTKALGELIVVIKKDKHHTKSLKPLPVRKINKKVPLIDCFTAPCREQCPIHQDIPAYLKLVKEEKYTEALKVITDKNALPFITGTICSHTCTSKCTRNFYEESIHIRGVKLVAVNKGYEDFIKEMKASDQFHEKQVAIVGAGPAGISCAFYLAREGAKVTVYEKRAEAGGVVKYAIPQFRISADEINKDVTFALQMGVKFEFNHPITDIKELKNIGYDDIVLAVGAYKGKSLGIPCDNEINALDFLESYKNEQGALQLGKNVAIVGAGNTAMDAARAAKRVNGVEHVYIVYRRTKRYMPAEEEELNMALEDGVELLELLSPVSQKDGKLLCHKVVLGEPDATGRQKPVETKETVVIDIDTVITSLGEKVDSAYYEAIGIQVNELGYAVFNQQTMETSIPHVYIIGDGANGPATVVEAMRDATKAANAILGINPRGGIDIEEEIEKLTLKKGYFKHAGNESEEADRCLVCNQVCEACVDVCPNRANIAIKVSDTKMTQILHVDYMCNECGNCKSFCPYDSAPYQEKFTLFHTLEEFENSKNEGFVLMDEDNADFQVRIGGKRQEINLEDLQCNLDINIFYFISTVYHDYHYLFIK